MLSAVRSLKICLYGTIPKCPFLRFATHHTVFTCMPIFVTRQIKVCLIVFNLVVRSNPLNTFSVDDGMPYLGETDTKSVIDVDLQTPGIHWFHCED